MSLYTIPCILFAGGKSSRMGEDKALLPFGGKETLAQFQYERLEELFTRVYISAKDASKFSGYDAVVIEDVIAKETEAPTAGFANVFKQLKAENAIFVLSVDTPFVDEKIIQKFLDVPNAQKYDAIIIRTPRGIHPLCGIYSRALELPLFNMLIEGEHKLTKLLENSNVFYIDIKDEDALLNLNTPEDYQRALALMDERL
jgi:molybdopterin-guanine dinucleotide biosynthesis protein A